MMMLPMLAQAYDGPPLSKGYEITAWVLIGLALLAFLLTAWRDLYYLIIPTKDLGSGFGRVWAVARTAIIESWAMRIWVVPIMWLIAVIIINELVVPYDDVNDTVSLYLSVCLYGQMFLVLVALMVLACFSFPRERERRTIITTGSKPLSRLEFFLGKITGFSAVGLMLLVFMGFVTYGYLLIVEQSVRTKAEAKYQLEDKDYQASLAKNPGGAAVKPPEPGLLNIARSGVLTAGNYVAPSQMQIAGLVLHSPKLGNVRMIKGGGSGERLVERFATVHSVGFAPTYVFSFTAGTLRENVKASDDITELLAPLPPDTVIALKVVISTSNGAVVAERYLEQTINVYQSQVDDTLFGTEFTPDLPMLYVPANNKEDQIPFEMQISCLTPGVYLFVRENRDVNDWNVAVSADHAHIMLPLRSPVIVGTEKYDKQEIAGPGANYQASSGMFNDGEVASFRFSKEDMKRVPRDKDGNATLSMYLDVDKSDRPNLQTSVDVEAYEKGGVARSRESVPVNEKILTEVKLPLTDAQNNDDLYVDIRSSVPGHWVSVVKDSVRFELSASPFIVNLMKSELVIFFSVVLLVTIAVVASVRVNGWVAMLVTLMAYFLGHALPFLYDLIGTGGNDLFAPGETAQFKSNIFYESMVWTQGIAVKVVYILAKMLPDFTKFDPTTHILQFRNMPLSELGSEFLWVVIFAAPLIAVGHLMIRKQELA